MVDRRRPRTLRSTLGYMIVPESTLAKTVLSSDGLGTRADRCCLSCARSRSTASCLGISPQPFPGSPGRQRAQPGFQLLGKGRDLDLFPFSADGPMPQGPASINRSIASLAASDNGAAPRMRRSPFARRWSGPSRLAAAVTG